MTTKVMRNIVKIDEAKCNGCGLCIPSCVEGALQIIDGKARLVDDAYCDGLGACLGDCPQGAISVEVREAVEFDEEAANNYVAAKAANEQLPCGCPSATVAQLEPNHHQHECCSTMVSTLGHWPVQLALVPPTASFLKGADVVLTAHCVPFAYAGFHRDFLADHVALAACPKLDDFQSHLGRLEQILRHAEIRSLTILHMEVPCCSGLSYMARQAIAGSGKQIPVRDVTISIDGGIKEETKV